MRLSVIGRNSTAIMAPPAGQRPVGTLFRLRENHSNFTISDVFLTRCRPMCLMCVLGKPVFGSGGLCLSPQLSLCMCLMM